MLVTILLVGDIMTGRGIDQVLSYSCSPELHESYVRSAYDYVELAENASGSISKPVTYSYVWGDALPVFWDPSVNVRIANLETSITTSADYWKGKGIHYRMHPKNITCLTASGVDCYTLANNHVLDWGQAGLEQTLESLRIAAVAFAGGGKNIVEAASPAIIEIADQGRVVVFAIGVESSGITKSWGATIRSPCPSTIRL